MESYSKINLELKSKFFKDTLLTELKNNNIELLSKKVTPHHKVFFVIKLIVPFTQVKKVKDIIKAIDEQEKENDRKYLEEQRANFGG